MVWRPGLLRTPELSTPEPRRAVTQRALPRGQSIARVTPTLPLTIPPLEFTSACAYRVPLKQEALSAHVYPREAAGPNATSHAGYRDHGRPSARGDAALSRSPADGSGAARDPDGSKRESSARACTRLSVVDRGATTPAPVLATSTSPIGHTRSRSRSWSLCTREHESGSRPVRAEAPAVRQTQGPAPPGAVVRKASRYSPSGSLAGSQARAGAARSGRDPAVPLFRRGRPAILAAGELKEIDSPQAAASGFRIGIRTCVWRVVRGVNTKRYEEDRYRRSNRLMRCCIGDGGTGRLGRWSSAAALRGEVANHCKVRRSRAARAERLQKNRAVERGRYGPRRRAKAIH